MVSIIMILTSNDTTKNIVKLVDPSTISPQKGAHSILILLQIRIIFSALLNT